ncbi:protein kinase [bacterium]|nr:protein kinase [bacterium]
MGVVFRAEDTKLSRIVALKFLPEELVTDETARLRLKREVEALAALRHNSICSIHDWSETEDGRPFIVMDHYEGATLKERVAGGPLPPRGAFEVAIQIAQGLQHAHGKGIVHRDIKPGNVMFDDLGFVKIVDFGLVKMGDRSGLTLTRDAMGTAAYMSPEQVTGGEVDGRADIWALGVVFHELLTGERPFEGNIEAALLYAIMNEDPPRADVVNAEVPSPFAGIVARCLQKDPGDRYQSADELLDDLDAAAGELGYGSSFIRPVAMGPLPEAVTRLARPMRRFLWIGAVVLAAVAAVIYLQTDVFRGEPPLYTTPTRLAVLELENMMPSAHDVFVDGVSEAVSQVVENLLRADEDAWVVPYWRVLEAPITAPTDAVNAFGVNRVVIGNVQRFGDERRISLRLCEAADLTEIRTRNIDFDRSGSALCDSFALAIAELLGVDAARCPEGYSPQNPAAIEPYIMGLGWLQRSRTAGTDSARAYFRAAVDADEGFALGFVGLGRADFKHFREHETDKTDWLVPAKNHLTMALSHASGLYEANLSLAQVFYFLEDLEQAVEYCGAALRSGPGDLQASLWLTWTYQLQDRYDEAESALRDAIAHSPDFWANHTELGVLYWRTDRPEEAISATEKAARFAPNDVTTINNLGGFHYHRDEWGKVREYFERAYHISPNCQTCGNMGWLAYYEGKYAESTRYYEFATEYCDTTNYELWGNLAAAQYWTKGLRARSGQSYARGIYYAEQEFERDPENHTIISSLINSYAFSGDLVNARRMIRYGEEHAGDGSEVLFSIACAHELFHERAAALRSIEAALRRGYPLYEIENNPSLADLVIDPLYIEMKNAINTGVATESPERLGN